jgi:hypothetical protein
MQFYEYKGFTIYPTPHLQLQSGCWQVQLTIRHDERMKIYASGNMFPTKGEAVFHSISYGKSLIDDGIVLLGDRER